MKLKLITQENILKLYMKYLEKYFSLNTKNRHAFVLEKPKPIEQKGLIKDGIHIIFPFINSSPWAQYIIRSHVLKEIDNVLKLSKSLITNLETLQCFANSFWVKSIPILFITILLTMFANLYAHKHSSFIEGLSSETFVYISNSVISLGFLFSLFFSGTNSRGCHMTLIVATIL